jgi:hypothetical protein
VRVIGFDVETFLIAPGVAAPKLVCGSFDDDDLEIGVELADDYLERFIGWLEDPNVVLIAHNLPFDLIVLLAEIEEKDALLGRHLLRAVFQAIRDRRLRDTLIREKILENAKGELKYDFDEDLGEFKRASFTLERCVWNRLKIFVNKSADTWRKRYGLLYGMPISEWPEDAVKYSIKDSTLGRRLFLAQEDAALAEGCPVHEDGLADIPGEIATTLTAFCFGLMRTWGVRTDLEMTKVVRQIFQVEFDAAVVLAKKWGLLGVKKATRVKPEYVELYGDVTKKEDLLRIPPEAKHRVVHPKRNMTKIKDRVRFLYASHGEDIPMSESGKNIATDRETLTFKRFPSWEKDEGLCAVANVVRYEKLLTTYVPILESGAKVPITPDWNAMVETFRISCSRPNLTNLPRGSSKYGDDAVRQCFVPRDGWVFVSADYSTLELCTLAQYCIDLFGYSNMAESINQGRDLHLDMASEILGLSYDDVARRYASGDKVVEETRQFAKIVDFGAPGGMGANSFVDYARGYDVNVTPDHAKRLLDAFRRRWSEMNDYFNYCSALCGDGGEAETVIHQRTGYVRGKVRYTALANFGFQHLAAVGAKAALCRAIEESYVVEDSPLFGCRPIIFPHDEIIMEVPRAAMGAERASAAADGLVRVMIEEMKIYCPDVLIKVEPCMTRRWVKGAKGVRVDGLLVPSRREGKAWVADLGEERRAVA